MASRHPTPTTHPDGIRVAVCRTKVHQRLLRPLLAADHPPASPDLRPALATVDHVIGSYIASARLGKPA